MQTIKTAVVGVGYLGKFHAEKYSAIPNSELIAVVDANAEVVQEIAQKLDVEALTDYTELKAKVDAVSIVVPTQLHYDTAKFFLENGIHVLVEKPITTTVDEATELVNIANKNKLIFQVGHLERFNPAILALNDVINKPLFIESHRVAPFNPRGADVNVILDLMIHDIDIIMNMVNSKVTHIDANGVKVLSSDIDIANTRLQFENGCVANVTASRAGLKSERKMRLFQHDAYIAIDFQNKKLGIHRKGDGEMHPGVSNIESEEQIFEQGDALFSEIESFLNAIANKTTPVVSGEDGRLALETALKITELLKKNS
ncbi:MAG: Gfo/Idh/MocA family oxidoreductase [Gammaproteobacteria bacterium]